MFVCDHLDVAWLSLGPGSCHPLPMQHIVWSCLLSSNCETRQFVIVVCVLAFITESASGVAGTTCASYTSQTRSEAVHIRGGWGGGGELVGPNLGNYGAVIMVMARIKYNQNNLSRAQTTHLFKITDADAFKTTFKRNIFPACVPRILAFPHAYSCTEIIKQNVIRTMDLKVCCPYFPMLSNS